MTRRAGAALLAALALALIGAACTDDTADVAPAGQSLTAPGGRRHLSDLGPASNLAEPTQPGPSREATLGNLTRWAINNGALAQTFDPDTGITWILLPKGSALDIDDIPDNARGATEARITTARYAKKTYDAAEDAVMELVASGPGQGSYTWDLRIDAEVGALSVGTDAPAAVTAPLSERFGGAIVFQRTEGGSFLAGPRAARPVPDR